MKNLMTKLLPIVKKIINKKINKIKLSVMKKIRSIKRIQPNKKVSNNREIESLENKFGVKAIKNMINTPKKAIEKSPVVNKVNVVTPIKIATKPKIVIEKNKTLQTYLYETPAIKVCESEMLSKSKLNRVDEDKNIPKD